MKTHPSKALLAVAVSLSVFASSHAVVISKDSAGTDLAAGSSWAGGNAPTSSDVATWTGSSLGGSLTMDSDLSWGGIDIQGATATVVISGTGTLTLGASGINVAAAGQDLTLGNSIVVGASQTWHVEEGRKLLINTTGSTLTFGEGTTTTLTGSGTVELGNNRELAGSGDLVIDGATLVNNLQGGTQSRTGNTTLNSGIIMLQSNVDIFGTGQLNLNGGAIGSGNSSSRTIANAVTIGGDIRIGGDGLSSGGMTFSGTVDLMGGVRTIETNVTTFFTGVISNGGITKTGSGVLRLAGDNTFTGATTVLQGALAIGNNALAHSSSVTLAAGTTLYIGANGTTTINNLSGDAGSEIHTAYNIDTTGARTLVVNQTVDGVFAGTIKQGNSGRTLSLVKDGSGTLTLSGTNTYSGGTTINNGTLVAAAAAALGTGAVQANGGTLATSVANVNTGAFNLAGGTLVLNGAGAGTITLSPGQDFNFTAGLWQIDLASGLDQIIGSGAGSDFTISGGVIDLGGGAIDYTQTYDLIAGFENINISGVGITGYDTANWQASINNNGELSFTAVPEPATYGLLGAGALAAAAMVRRRRRKASDASPVTE